VRASTTPVARSMDGMRRNPPKMIAEEYGHE
jgi:hypothetical protein